MSGSEILFSGAMLQSPNYVASVEAGELVPMITLSTFRTEEEDWTWWEKLVILYKTLRGTEYGNSNPALWRIGPKEDGIYLAVTDGKDATRFNISDLSTLGQESPPIYPLTTSGCAHWMREVGTDNSIYFSFKQGLTGDPWMEVVRYRPESSFQSPDIIATLTPTKFSYIHSFSITENYAVFFFYPVIIDNAKVLEANFHVFEAFKWSNKTENTDIFVVDLKSGEVKGLKTNKYLYKDFFHPRTLRHSLGLLCSPHKRVRGVAGGNQPGPPPCWLLLQRIPPGGDAAPANCGVGGGGGGGRG